MRKTQKTFTFKDLTKEEKMWLKNGWLTKYDKKRGGSKFVTFLEYLKKKYR